MEFELSADQTALESAAADLLDGLASAQRVRRFVGPGTTVDSEDTVTSEEQTGPGAGGFDRPLWEAMADQGWLGVERPESDGGLGLGMVEVAVLCEQVGRRVAPAPFLGSILAMVALQEAGIDDPLPPTVRETAAGWAARLSAGDAVGCVAWAALPGAVTVRRDGGQWLLDGRPEPTLYADVADVAVVVTDDAVYAVELDEIGRPPAEPAMDRTRPLAWLRLAGTPARRIGGRSAASRLVDRAATGSAAELLGASAHVLEMSVEYAKVRHQFGHPIGSFQAIKHRLADALVDVEAMRSCTYYAAWCVASHEAEASLAASMAKAWCSDASQRVMASGMQVHGGIGFTWDHDLHLFLKRARHDAAGFGTAAWHRDRIAGILERRLAEGVSPL